MTSKFVLLGGGHEAELKKYVGSGFDGHPLWICRYLVENPKALRKVCQEYIQGKPAVLSFNHKPPGLFLKSNHTDTFVHILVLAGAEMVLTNTYQATVDGFMKHINLSKEKSVELIKLGVKICKEAIELEQGKETRTDAVAVAGCVGPYGAYLHDGSEYAGGHYVDQMTTQDLAEWHRPQVEALIEAEADCLLFGTIPSLKEAEAIISLVKEYPNTKVILSFSAQNEETISHGERMSEVARRCWELASEQILAVGVNCQHPRFATALLRSVRQAHPHIPLFVRPNTTEVFNTSTKRWESVDDAKSLREYCREWLELGVEYISGCCRTSCKDIKDFREEICKFERKNN